MSSEVERNGWRRRSRRRRRRKKKKKRKSTNSIVFQTVRYCVCMNVFSCMFACVSVLMIMMIIIIIVIIIIINSLFEWQSGTEYTNNENYYTNHYAKD